MSLSLHEAFKVHILDVQNPLQNYIFLLEDVRTHDVVVIDPTHAEFVLNYCQQHSLNIKHIWITHHHQDHTAGIADLVAKYAVPVYAPQDELSKIPCATHGLSHEQVIDFNDIQIEIIATAGHTLGHICYFIDTLDTLFSGDTLFVMGCGRVIEGTHQQMYHSLNRLAALPARTVVYCSHEYSLNNAQFALHIEPDNLAVQQRLADIQQLREQNLPTVPTTIAQELESNPFLRALSLEQFSERRRLKDEF